MKKFFLGILMLLPMLFVGCQQEEIVFDYEKIHFETKANAILLEVVVPSTTAPTDEIYVLGAFNDNAKTADFMLTKHEDTNIKFGIYLYPEDFVEGKTLADGFVFYNAKQGAEAVAEPHVIANAQLGERYVISFSRWQGLGDQPEIIEPGEYEHLYITGNVEGSSWDPAAPIELAMVGTDIFRGEVTFTDETSYFAIATEKGDWDAFNATRWGADNALLVEGEVLDLKPQDGSDQCVTIAQGTYTLTVNMVEKQIVIGEGNWNNPSTPKFPTTSHDGDAVYVMDAAGWGAMRIYMYGDENDLNGGWPGMEPTEVIEFQGATWYLFDMKAENAGKAEHLIINDGNGAQIDAAIEPYITLTGGDSIYYYVVKSKSELERIDDPNTYDYGGGSGDDEEEEKPEPVIPDSAVINLYVIDATETLAINDSVLSIYAWGANECFGGWPGAAVREWNKVTFFGFTMYTYSIPCLMGETFNLIANNKAGELGHLQYDVMAITASDYSTDYFIELKDDHATEMVPTPAGLRKR